MEPFLEKKWDHVFNVFFDINGSEMLEWDDFQILIEKIRVMRQADPKEVDVTTKALQQIWDGLLNFADLDNVQPYAYAKNANIFLWSATSYISQEKANPTLQFPVWAKVLDNKISLYEWHEMWKTCVANKQFPKWQDTYLKYTFNLLDSSGDGQIDCSEYVEIMMIYGISPQEAEDAFDKFAVSEDGRAVNMINFDQFCALWNEYFHSQDTNAPGNYLFGMIL